MATNLNEAKESRAKHWLSYRPEIKVFDVTIRDGGLMNDHQFDDEIVRAVYEACVDAGIDYMELGYKASKRILRPTSSAPGSIATEDDMRRIVGDKPDAAQALRHGRRRAHRLSRRTSCPARRASWTWSAWPPTSTRSRPRST